MSTVKQVIAELESQRAKAQQEIARLDTAIGALQGLSDSPAAKPGPKPGKKRGMSAAGRARIAAAQRARWARQKGAPVVVTTTKPRRKMSRAARAKIGAARRAWWAQKKAQEGK